MQLFKQMRDENGVIRVFCADREFILLGTAHVSQRSCEEAQELITRELPDQVCVEIDAQRYQALTTTDKWRNLDLLQIIKQKKAPLLFVNLLLSSFQRKIGDQVGVKPGQELLKAIETANQLGLPIVMADRPIEITMRRAWRLCGWWSRMKLLSMLFTSLFYKESISSDKIEELKNDDMLHKLTSEMGKELPQIKEVLIDERDRYLAHSIFGSEGKRIVAIVGAGHLHGIVSVLEQLYNKQQLGEACSCEELLLIPSPSKLNLILPWLLPVVVLLLLAGFFFDDHQLGWNALLYWALANSGLTFLFTLVSLAHPLTVLIAAVAAPITSLNPAIGAGFVAIFAELWLRKPRVCDLEELHNSLLSIHGWYGNRITRSLLVMFFSTMGSATGTWLAVVLLSRNILS